MTESVGVPIGIELGADWVRGSLARGSHLAESMTRRLDAFTSAWMLIQPSQDERLTSPDDNGRGLHRSDADRMVARLLETFARAGANTVVVEDDLARRGDPAVGIDAAFVDDHVIRWSGLNLTATNAVRLLHTGASGYPLNAFVCWPSAADLGLAPGTTLDQAQQAAIINSTAAVIVSVYDAEAYLVLMSRDLQSAAQT